ncbi:MAG: hypothetical protein U1F35_11965 [Steroidobacteraceae bacterium]
MSMHVLVFDIETVPDTDLGRRLFGLHDLSMRRSRRSCSRTAGSRPAASSSPTSSTASSPSRW